MKEDNNIAKQSSLRKNHYRASKSIPLTAEEIEGLKTALNDPEEEDSDLESLNLTVETPKGNER